MGQLVTAISHELSKPLSGINILAQASLSNIEKNSPLSDDLKKIIEETAKMIKVLENARLFALESELRKSSIDINDPIKDTLMLVGQELKLHNINVYTSLSGGLPKIYADHNQLQHIFLNIIANARDAIDSKKDSQGGSLTIETKNGSKKNTVEVTFKDNGCGIPSGNLKKVFIPFFTTKSSSGAIGLGLCTAYRIIENHHGNIEVESDENMGTTIKITVPAAIEDDSGTWPQN
ncbi:MAG: ATP-binding protein [Candidatus Omnitrophota bacterium]